MSPPFHTLCEYTQRFEFAWQTGNVPAADFLVRKICRRKPKRCARTRRSGSLYRVSILQNICKWSGTYRRKDSENTLLPC